MDRGAQTGADKMAASQRLALESTEPSPQAGTEVTVRVKGEGGAEGTGTPLLPVQTSPTAVRAAQSMSDKPALCCPSGSQAGQAGPADGPG